MRSVWLLFCLAISASAFGQNGTYVDAKPKLDVTCPAEVVMPGSEFDVTAVFSPIKRGNPSYNWTVSAGTIVRGQGTPVITVKADLEGIPIDANVEIGGGPFWFERLAESCRTVVAMLPKPRLLGEFGVKNIGYVELMFDDLFRDLWNEPNAIGTVSILAPNAKEHARLKRWALRLARGGKFDASRLSFVNGGKASAGRVRLWVVPAGAETPKQ